MALGRAGRPAVAHRGRAIERGVEVDHVTIYRWVLRFTPLVTDAGTKVTPAKVTRPGTSWLRKRLGAERTCSF